MPKPNPGPRLKWLDKRKSFYIVWYEQGRERSKATGTTDSGTAEATLAEFIRERRAAAKPDGPRDPGSLLIADALDLYGRIHGPTATDPARIAYAIDALLPFWGESTVASITKATCQRYQRERKRAPATVRRELTTLRAALNMCVREGHLTAAPAVWLPKKPEGKNRWLTVPEAARLLNVARTARADVRLYLPLFIVIALYTGARKEAILSLRWPQVDLDGGRINFGKGREKTTKGRAHIPIPRQLRTFLRLAWKRRMSDVGFVIHDKCRPIKDIGAGWNGKYSAPGAYEKPQGSFGRACRDAGLIGVTPHTLRHTRGTWSAQAGVDLHKLAGWLGQSYATTVELYAHHHPDFMDEAKAAAERRKA